MERSRIRVVEMGNLRGLLGIRRMNRVLNARSREKGLMKVFSVGLAILKEMRMNKKKVYVGECGVVA